MSIQFLGMIGHRLSSETIAPVGPIFDRDYIVRFAQTHEAAGFDRLLVGHWSDQPDGFLVTALAGLSTQKIQYLLAHRPGFVSPTLAARKFATLEHLLGGRLAEGQPGGVALTLLMAIGATLLALPGGIALAGLAWRYGGLVRRLLFLWAEIIRGIPLIFVIFWLWYLLPMLTGGDLPGAVTVTLALAWFTAASVMHSVLAGLQSLPKGQYEAALTQGFAPGQTLRLVLLPQALRNVQPSLVGIFIGLLKDTSLAFIVNVPELTTVAGQVNNRVQIYPLAIFVFTGAVYYLLCCGLSLLASRRFTRRATTR